MIMRKSIWGKFQGMYLGNVTYIYTYKILAMHVFPILISFRYRIKILYMKNELE